MKKKEDERRQYSVSDTGILGEKELLSAYNRSQIYDLWISMLDALNHSELCETCDRLGC